MKKRHLLNAALSLGCFAAISTSALAQGSAGKPTTIVVPFSTGGATDIVARLVAQQLGGPLGAPVLVENRTGGAGAIGWGSVARAAPDGHTLITTELSYAIAAGLNPNLPFDPRNAFSHITTAVSVPHVLVVTPGLPAKTMKEFLALARAKPGSLNYGSGGIGTNTHLGSELLKSQTGIFITHIPYRGAGAVLTDLMGGQVQMMISTVTTVLPHIKSGKLRPLMVLSNTRSPVLPDVPSAKDEGLPEMAMDFWVGFSAPAGTPQPIIEKLNRDINTVLNLPEVKKRSAEMGLTTVASSQAAATQQVESEIKRWSALIKQQGIKPE